MALMYYRGPVVFADLMIKVVQGQILRGERSWGRAALPLVRWGDQFRLGNELKVRQNVETPTVSTPVSRKFMSETFKTNKHWE